MLIVAIAALVVLVLLAGPFRAMWRVAEPNEGLIVTGKGMLVLPGVQRVRRSRWTCTRPRWRSIASPGRASRCA